MHTTPVCVISRADPGKPLLATIRRLLISAFIAMAAPIALAQGSPPTNGSNGNNAVSTSLLKDLTVIAGSTVTRDSNLFRRPTAQSETITSGYIGLRLDKAIAQQQFQLDITQRANRYDRFKYLDFDSLDYGGAWNWKLGKRYSGKLSASRAESLAPFEDTVGGVGRNVRITRNQALDVNTWASGDWHLLLGLSQSDQKSEQNVQSRTPDFRATNGSIGIKYLTRSGNALTIRQQKTDGEYTNAPPGTLNTNYTENLSELSADWKLNAISTLNGRLGWLERSNEDVTRRSFSGQSSSVSYAWNPGGKLSMTVSAAKKATPLQDLTASYRDDQTLSFSPSWRISEKTSTFLRLSYQKSTDRDVRLALPTGPRRDTTNTAVIGLEWAATRTLSVNASFERQERTSNNAISNYETTIGRIGAALAF